jgi:2'-5' RNA ligase
MTDTFQIDTPDSVIITLEPDPESRVALRVEDGVPDAIPAKEYHLTLVRVGGIAETKNLSDILQSLLGIAANTAPMMGDVSGAGFFGPDGFNGNTVMLVDIDGLTEFRNELVEALLAAKVSVDEDYDFIPHITVAKGPVIAPESKVGTELSFGNFGLRFGPQAALVPFMLEPEPVMVPEVVPEPLVEGEVPVPDAGLEAPEGTAAASVEDVGKNAEAVDGLMSRLVEEFGKFLQGPGGKFIGSEPDGGGDSEGGDGEGGGAEEPAGGGDSGGGDNPFTGGDRMADVLPASGDEFADETEAAAVGEVIAAGGDIFNAAGGDADMTSEDRDSIIQMNNEVESAMQPAPAGVEIYTTAFVTDRYTLDPETGSVTRDSRGTTVDALQSAGSSVEGAPEFTVGSGDPASALKFAGEGTYVYGRPDGSLGRMEGQRVPIKVTVPEGHPMVNAGRDNDVNPDADTNVVLSRDTSLTVTGFGVDAETGAAMFTAEATLRPSGA